MRVTINDVAKAAEVAPSTVSRVIANNPRIGSETRERVLRVMKELNYHPNALARSLASKSTRIFAVVIPSETEKALRHPFYSEILSGIGSQAHRLGYKILIASANNVEEERAIINDFAKGGIAEGIILLTARVKDPAIRELRKMHFPFVVVGHPQNEEEVNWVDNNNRDAGYMLTKHLIDQGCRRIAFIGMSPQFMVTMERHEGYRQALEEAGIPYDESLISDSCFIENTGYEMMTQLCDTGRLPEAVIACDDMLAFGALKCLHERNIRIPEDILVAGFNNLPLSDYITPALTSVDIHAFTLGSRAFELLHQNTSSGQQVVSRRK